MKLSRKWRIAIMCVVSLVVLWLIYYAVVSVIYRAKLRRLRAEVVASGSSLNLKELAGKYDVLSEYSEKNGALLYRAAGLAMESVPSAPTDPEWEAQIAVVNAKPGERLKTAAGKREPLTSLLRRYDLSLRLLHEGAQRERAWFVPDYGNPLTMEMRYLAHLRSAARFLQIESWLAALDGDSHRTLEAARTGLRLRRSIEREPVLISFLVGIAVDTISLQTLPDVLAAVRPSADDLRRLLAEVQAVDRQSLRISMEGQRATAAMAFESARRDGIAPALMPLLSDLGKPRAEYGVVAASLFARVAHALPVDESYALASISKQVAAASRVESMTPEEADRMDAEFINDHSSLCWRAYHPFSSHLVLGLSRLLLVKAKQDLARHDVAACGIAAELYRLDHGRYPARLEALAPKYLAKVPLDTFSGKPLLFTALPNGVHIRSVGEPWKDPASPGHPPPPIEWRIERATGAESAQTVR